VAGEGLRDDVHAVGDDAAEDGRRHDHPQLPGLLPYPWPELAVLALAGGRRRHHHLPLLLHVAVQQRHAALLVVRPRVRGHRIGNRMGWNGFPFPYQISFPSRTTRSSFCPCGSGPAFNSRQRRREVGGESSPRLAEGV
jgi:hypothetical protein